MPTITPPPPPQPPTVTPTPAPVLTVSHPPVELARLTIGGLLEASVLNQVGKETYLLQTRIGQLTVTSAVALPKEANLVLQILSLSPQALLQINVGNAAATGAMKQAIPSAGTLAVSENPTGAKGDFSDVNRAATAPPLTVGSVLKAVLVRPSLQPRTAAAGNAPVSATTSAATVAAGSVPAARPGAVPSATPQTIAPSATGEPKQPAYAPVAAGAVRRGGITGPLLPGSGGPIKTASPVTAGVPTLRAAPALPTGTQLSFRITDIQLPSPAANNIITPSVTAGPAALGAGKILTGVITGTTALGHPVVQTEAGVFSLNTQSTTPRGSIVTLAVTSAPKPVSPAAASPAHPGSDSAAIFAERRWPPLEEAVRVLHDSNPAASRQFVGAILPRPDAQLTSGLIFFLSALRGGDLRPWFGETNMRILENSRPKLANKLARDFNMLAKVADEPAGADWRVAMIPVNTGTQIEQIRMLLRHHHDENDEGAAGDNSTRFILDIDLSRLGRIQLDGLVRDKGRKLDLIIRSGDVLDDPSRNEIRRIFSEAADLTGLTGSVGFQAAPPDFIEIPDPLAEKTVGLIV